MPTIDPRVDAYIAASPAFAQPILTHIRAVVHGACPNVEETMKWRMPHFQYKGMLCQMSAFTAHCALGFWQGAILFPDAPEKASMGHFGRITSIKDLPSKKELTAIVRHAMKLNDDGVTRTAKPRVAPKDVIVPEDFAKALMANPAAHSVFDAGSPSFQREYVAWIDDAKAEATRLRRMAQALAWLAEGKGRNWKYEKC
ncbi:MAG: YdeI/OmpD-associated family protein [Telluria sp.]